MSIQLRINNIGEVEKMAFEKFKKDVKGIAGKAEAGAKDLGVKMEEGAKKIEEKAKDTERTKAAKILSDVKPENAFLFSSSEGVLTGKRAQNLNGLCEAMHAVDLKSVEFHLQRRDFEKWIAYLGDEILALQIGKIRIMPFDGERTRAKIVETITDRVNKLKALLASP